MSIVTISGYLVGKKGTANEQNFRITETIEKENAIRRGHDITNKIRKIKQPLEGISRDRLANSRSIYGVRLQPLPPQKRIYDLVHSADPGWAEKVKKDDYRNLTQYRKNARQDERNRQIPILTNSEYGHRSLARVEPFKRAHHRITKFHNELYTRNGLPWL